jgi:hypothetical protein
MADKMYYFLKLNPPRPSFTLDMTAEERQIMQDHAVYWRPHVDNGTAIVIGPVLDPKGGYGVAILGVKDEQELNQLVNSDPATALGTYEIYPMAAMTRSL